MSFVEQPQDTLVEQLLNTDVISILAACRANTVLSNYCRRRDLWDALIRRDYPSVDLTTFANPREFYLRYAIFAGGIYVNGVQQEVQAFPYKDILSVAGQLLNQSECVVILSRPTWELNNPNAAFSFEILAVMTPGGTVHQNKDIFIPSIENKVTQIDVVDMDQLAKSISDENFANLPYLSVDETKLELGVTYDVSAYSNTGEIITLPNVKRGMISRAKGRTLRSLTLALRAIHRDNNSTVYQKYSENIRQLRHVALTNPKLPNILPLAASPFDNESIIERKERIYQQIITKLQALDNEEYEDHILSVARFTNFEELLAAQRTVLEVLTDNQVAIMEYLLNSFLNEMTVTDDIEDVGRNVKLNNAIFFGADGRLILHT